MTYKLDVTTQELDGGRQQLFEAQEIPHSGEGRGQEGSGLDEEEAEEPSSAEGWVTGALCLHQPCIFLSQHCL